MKQKKINLSYRMRLGESEYRIRCGRTGKEKWTKDRSLALMYAEGTRAFDEVSGIPLHREFWWRLKRALQIMFTGDLKR